MSYAVGYPGGYAADSDAGAFAAAPAAFAATGTETISGTAALAGARAALSGSGTAVGPVTGTGALAAARAALAATGTETGMTTIYPGLPATGPWVCDDTEVLCDGEAFAGPAWPWMDGIAFDPWDITEIDGSRLISITSLAAYANGVSRGGTYQGEVNESGSHDYVIEQAGNRAAIDKGGNSDPVLTKTGSP